MKGVNLSKYNNGEGTFIIMHDGVPRKLFTALKAVADTDLTLVSIFYNTMAIAVF